MSGALIASRAFLVLLGPFAGDYAATLASAWPRAPRPMTGRSRCSRCGAQISLFTQIPLVSWAFQGGRRRCCGGRIPLVYPIGEAAGLASGVAAACAASPAVQAWTFALGLTLTYIALVDLRRFSIPAWGLAALGLEAALLIAASPSMEAKLVRLAGPAARWRWRWRRCGGSARAAEAAERQRPRRRRCHARRATGDPGGVVASRAGSERRRAGAQLTLQWLRRRSGPVAFGLVAEHLPRRSSCCW